MPKETFMRISVHALLLHAPSRNSHHTVNVMFVSSNTSCFSFSTANKMKFLQKLLQRWIELMCYLKKVCCHIYLPQTIVQTINSPYHFSHIFLIVLRIWQYIRSAHNVLQLTALQRSEQLLPQIPIVRRVQGMVTQIMELNVLQTLDQAIQFQALVWGNFVNEFLIWSRLLRLLPGPLSTQVLK